MHRMQTVHYCDIRMHIVGKLPQNYILNNKRIQQEIEAFVLYLKIATLTRVEKKNEPNLNSCIRTNSPQKRIHQHAPIW